MIINTKYITTFSCTLFISQPSYVFRTWCSYRLYLSTHFYTKHRKTCWKTKIHWHETLFQVIFYACMSVHLLCSSITKENFSLFLRITRIRLNVPLSVHIMLKQALLTRMILISKTFVSIRLLFWHFKYNWLLLLYLYFIKHY